MSDAQIAASPADLFETVKALSQITHGGTVGEFDLSDPFVQGRRGPYVGVAYKMGLIGRDKGPGPKRRLTEVGALALELLKDVSWDEARRTWGDRVRRLALLRPEHAASILPLAGTVFDAAGSDMKPAPRDPAAAALAARTRVRIGLPTYGILECLEDVRRATQNGSRTVVAKGEHSFTRFTSAVLFGILRVGEPDTRALTERGRLLLSGPAAPGYRKCLERAFEEQHIFVLIRDEMAQRGQPDLKKVAKKIRAYRPDLSESVRMQIARAFASSLALLRQEGPPAKTEDGPGPPWPRRRRRRRSRPPTGRRARSRCGASRPP